MESNYLEIWQGLTDSQQKILVYATKYRVEAKDVFMILDGAVLYEKGLFEGARATGLGERVVKAWIASNPPDLA